MMCRSVLVLLLVTSVLTDDHLPESAMERQLSSAEDLSAGGVSTAGGEDSSYRQSRQMDTELTKRQGPFGRPNMMKMTVDALNPFPYVMGGLHGVRDVIQQKFFPWRGMMFNGFTRHLPRPPPPPPPSRFRGPVPGPMLQGGPINLEQGGGGGFRGGGGGFRGGGGGFRGGGNSVRAPSLGPGDNKFRDEVGPLTTDDPTGSGRHPDLRSQHADSPVRRNIGRAKRSLQFDGWYPMDVSNPMMDEPTLGYQPPPLERVHFSDDPVDDNPMYPVKPQNPTVFVVRAEPKEPELHSVYGTENIEYFHIHPQTNTIRAFRAPSQSVGAIQFVSSLQFGETKGNSKRLSSSNKPVNNNNERREFLNRDIPEKDAGFSDKADVYDEIRFLDKASQYEDDYDQDIDGSFSEYSAIVVRPDEYNRREYSDIDSYQYQQVPVHRRYDFIDLPPSRERQNSRLSRPALYELLGNFKYESQIEETPYLGSATDSARASIFREVPPPNFFQTSASRRNSNQQIDYKDIPRSGPRGPTYRKTGLDDPSSRPWYLIDTKSERRREPSIASYIHTETRLGDERVHYKPLGPISYVSKDSERARVRDAFYNPHLDDHMNSYKPSTSLTANSLSELLQIFRFTQVTDKPGEGVTEDPITVLREFRYTRPTEDTPTTVPSFGDNFPTNFRYTSTPSSVSENDITEIVNEPPKNVPFDAVADTNSLDGYLFSDSEASPEYAHPEVKPNIVIIEGKDAGNSKGLIKEEVKNTASAPSNATLDESKSSTNSSKNIRPAFENLEIIYPGPTPKTTTLQSSSWPLYIIHEGHSKVKVFGINSTGDKTTVSKTPDVFILTDEPTTLYAETTFPETTTSSPFTSTTHTSTTTHIIVDLNSTYTPTTTFATTPSHPSTNEPVVETLPQESNDKYEYYYYDDGEAFGPELAFGGDYNQNGWEGPSLRFPGPSVTFEIPSSSPSQRSPDSDIAFSGGNIYTDVFQDRLPRAESSHSISDHIPLLPAVALTRDQLSVARPVFFTKRQQRSDTAEGDASVSQPFEYLSHLRQLDGERPSDTTLDQGALKSESHS